MTYGRSVFKELDKFHLDVPRLAGAWAGARCGSRRLHEAAWREMLRTGLTPPAFRPPPTPPPAPPLARTKLARRVTAATNAAIDLTIKMERRPLSAA